MRIAKFEKAGVASGQTRLKNLLKWETLGVPAALVVLSAFFALQSPAFLTGGNLLNVGQQSAAVALAAWGMTLVIISAGIDLSVGSVAAFASVVGVDLMVKHGTATGVAAMILMAIAMGAFNGVVIAKLRIPPFIATLAMMSIARGAALTYTGAVPVFGLESKFIAWLGNGSVLGIPANVIVALLGFILTYVLLTRTRFGVYTYAMGSNEIATRWAGIAVDRYKILIYTYAGLMWGLTALVLTSRVNSGQPLLASGLELQAIAAVCIGGTSLMGGVGTLTGTLWGVILIGVLNNGLNLLGISSLVQRIIIGFTILLAVLVSVWRQKQ
jgi:ribose/xylose/arabinose/galactoside ABC-type transport system permease subunit